MTKDRFERRAYRKSPGRQYGYDYDPLRSQKRSGSSQSGRLDNSTAGDRWPSNGDTTNWGSSRPGLQLAQRPDPRRTRQLLRQSILASKSHSTPLHEDETEQPDDVMRPPTTTHTRHPLTDDDQSAYEEHEDSTLFRNRYRAHNNRPVQPPMPAPQRYDEIEGVEEEGEWDEFDFVDPDVGYEDPLERRLAYPQAPSQKSPAPRVSTTARRMPEDYQRGSRRSRRPEYDDDEYGDEEEEVPVRRRAKKRGLTRRKLLLGLGAVAVGGVAAYELGPKIPGAINNVGTNIEHEIQDAYNRGLAAGAEAVRKEFITALDSLEGVSLQAAMAAAKLTRVAYDAFVSPLVTLAATVTGDFLNVTLQALGIARGFLAKFNQDNETLAALQTVLQNWVKQAHELPKQLQSITDADLDGAQAYLRALQRKIQDEQAKLNSQSTPTPAPKPTTKPKG